MKTKLLLILIAVIPFCLLGEDFSDIRPSKATLSMKEGDMEVLMTKQDGNTWEIKSFVKGGRIFEREEISTFELNKNTLIPLTHKIRMRIFFKKIKANSLFNWEDKKIYFSEGKEKGSVDLLEGTQGPSTIQLKMRLDLRNLNPESLPKKINYLVFFRGEIKNRTYNIEGFENIKTPMGEYKTLKLSREFLPGDDREQIYWFAPQLDFTLVRILNIDERKSDLTLKSFEFLD
tara:strand:- start:340 stop:1035 length:696 start_codon:yes stop_codon:yes gene_type:complete